MDFVDGSFLRTAAAGALAVLILLFRPIYNETANALVPSLSGIKRIVALMFGIASMFWLLIVAGLIYEPIVLFAPRLLPFDTGTLRLLLVFEVGLLILLPFVMGATEAALTEGPLARRLSLLPRAFIHIAGFGLALIALIPWIAWRFVVVAGLTRWKVDQLRIEIDTDRYNSVTDELEAALRRAGLSASSTRLPKLVLTARWLMYRLGPPLLRPRSEYEARRIVGNGYSLLVFDGLIDSIAQRKMRRPVRAALIGGIPPDGLWLTQTEQARELEKRIRADDAELSDIPKRLSEIDATHEEWRVLSWEYALVLAKRDNQRQEAEDKGGRRRGRD